MFTLTQIQEAHATVKTGADFPRYMQSLVEMGVIAFETYVRDSHSIYLGKEDFQIASKGMYEPLNIAEESNPQAFCQALKVHQEGKTDYYTFCKDCATTGIEKWIVDTKQMSCTYYNKVGEVVWKENIPSS